MISTHDVTGHVSYVPVYYVTAHDDLMTSHCVGHVISSPRDREAFPCNPFRPRSVLPNLLLQLQNQQKVRLVICGGGHRFHE